MDPSQIILQVIFYSKSSKNNQYILPYCQEIENSNSNTLVAVNIDSAVIREKIIKDTKINVDSVPCFLDVYKNGTINKFTGQNFYRKFFNIIQFEEPSVIEMQKIEPILPNPSPPQSQHVPTAPPPPHPEPAPPIPSVDANGTKLSSLDNLTDDKPDLFQEEEETDKKITTDQPKNLPVRKNNSINTLAQQMKKEREEMTNNANRPTINNHSPESVKQALA